MFYSFSFLVATIEESASYNNYNFFNANLKPQRSTTSNSNVKDQADWILQNWEQHVQELQDWILLRQLRGDSELSNHIKSITAYLEPPINATVPNTGNRSFPEGIGTPPTYIRPLPLRTQTPNDLRKAVYSKVESCKDMQTLLPVDRGLQIDPNTGQSIVWNVGEDPTPIDDVEKELKYCPVDGDPFLPWIHDVFWNHDQNQVHFIAQNKRRCKTGKGYGSDLERLEPQVALLQSVSIQRLSADKEEIQQLAPELWQKQSTATNDSSIGNHYRYRLVPYDQADVNATRFICKFHTWTLTSPRIELGETLSEFPFNYELADYRKNPKRLGLLSRYGKDNGKFWTSTLLFSCPIPKGITALNQQQNTIPLLYVDIIPIRTPPRYPIRVDTGGSEQQDSGYYFHSDWVGPMNVGRFDPSQAWGTRHILPEIEASGRLQNLPVCPLFDGDHDAEKSDAGADNEQDRSNELTSRKKKHLLSACLWAAASFRTRGTTKELTSDTKDRLKEWIEFHLLVGFDHIYVYDNSLAHTNGTNLSEITDMYPKGQVTRIEWPSVVCNNNIPANDNTGERSSQYAAENSCRERYKHRTEWIAVFDTDEYLVPMGEHVTLRTVVENAKDTNILSFRSTRGKLRYSVSE